MPQSRLHVMSVIMFGLPSIIAYSGCGYYDEAFDRAYEETIGECPPNENTEGGCKYVFDCVPELSWTWTADDETACFLPGDDPNNTSGKCKHGECKLACIVDENCECGKDKPCGEIECYDVTCDHTCKYTLKMPTQDGELIACKLADLTTNGYCNSTGTCVECDDNISCPENQGLICFDSKCIIPKPIGSECKDEIECESGFCTDGVCCDKQCDGECRSCNVAPDVKEYRGRCNWVPPGAPDDSCPAGAYSGCANVDFQIDLTCQSGLLNGMSCMDDKQCLSGQCVGGGGSGGKICKQNGGICSQDSDCASKICGQVTHLCWPK